MPFKGNISRGSKVEAELQLAGGAGGSAMLAMSFADNGGGTGACSAVAAPGGANKCDVQTNPGPTGRLVVFADLNNNNDSGQLTVRVNGQIRNSEPITGDTTWSYSLA